MRNGDAARRDITLHFLELGRADVAAVVVAVVGAIGQIEELRDKFQLGPFTEADGLGAGTWVLGPFGPKK